MTQDRIFKRSSITKMLVAELIRTTHALPKGEEQYEAQTYLSPTGRTIAKVMVCGTAIEKEDVGKDSSHWRLRISEASGSVQIYAGMYQTEAAAVIAQLEVPCFVSVVGKMNIYEPEDGSHIVSIRPDSLTVIDGKTRDDFILDASLSLIRSVRKTDDETMKRVASIYGEKDDKETYMFVARQAIESLLPDTIPDARGDHRIGQPRTPNYKAGEDKDKESKQNTTSAPPPKHDSKSTKASPSSIQGKTDKLIDSGIQTVQEVVLEILKEKGTVKYEDLPELLKARNINPLMVDWTSAVRRIMDEGMCFEPKIGVLRYSA